MKTLLIIVPTIVGSLVVIALTPTLGAIAGLLIGFGTGLIAGYTSFIFSLTIDNVRDNNLIDQHYDAMHMGYEWTNGDYDSEIETSVDWQRDGF
jgi:hypothetical protein